MNNFTIKHCSNCGALNPEITEYSKVGEEGFTVCCHESLCHGNKQYVFGNDHVCVRACCWACAEEQFIKNGVDVLEFDSMQRYEE